MDTERYHRKASPEAIAQLVNNPTLWDSALPTTDDAVRCPSCGNPVVMLTALFSQVSTMLCQGCPQLFTPEDAQALYDAARGQTAEVRE